METVADITLWCFGAFVVIILLDHIVDCLFVCFGRLNSVCIFTDYFHLRFSIDELNCLCQRWTGGGSHQLCPIGDRHVGDQQECTEIFLAQS